MGVKADLSKLPYCCVFPLEEPFEYAGCKWSELRIYNYAAYKEHAPEGCTTLTCLLIGESYGFWKAAKADGTDKDKKKELGELFVNRLAEFIPEVGSALEVIDVATPCTYERYTGSYEGSWMSVWEKGGKQYNYPQTLDTVFGVYFAGQRIQMPGGLPIAVYTGRLAVQHLCRDFGEVFV
jgi:phytoene dehydrogenase-like protein